MTEWFFSIETGSAGTFRTARAGHKYVDYAPDGTVIGSNVEPVMLKWLPAWPGDGVAEAISYSFGFNC